VRIKYGTKSASLRLAMNSEGESMKNEDHGGKQDQLEKHSLPGTNQAGKGPSVL
jgi:hypothetical protein